MAGFLAAVLIPLGRLQTFPIPLLARGAVLCCSITGNRESERSMVVPNQDSNEPKRPTNSTKPKKSRERSLPVPVPASAAPLDLLNPDAAGIDVHSNMHMV